MSDEAQIPSDTSSSTQNRHEHLEALINELTSRVASLEAAKISEEEGDGTDADSLDAIDDPENPFKFTTVSTEVKEIDVYPEGDVTFVCTAGDGKKM